jgi:hypothetical protein
MNFEFFWKCILQNFEFVLGEKGGECEKASREDDEGEWNKNNKGIADMSSLIQLFANEILVE